MSHRSHRTSVQKPTCLPAAQRRERNTHFSFMVLTIEGVMSQPLWDSETQILKHCFLPQRFSLWSSQEHKTTKTSKALGGHCQWQHGAPAPPLPIPAAGTRRRLQCPGKGVQSCREGPGYSTNPSSPSLRKMHISHVRISPHASLAFLFTDSISPPPQ